jgi:hypothetical protein
MAFPLYVDEDSMRRAVVEALRARAVDVLTALDAGMIERDDEEHLAFGAAHGRALLSFNVGDFHRLPAAWLARSQRHAGIVLAQQQRYSVGELVRRLLNLLAARSAEDMVDRVEFLSGWG